LDWAGGALPPEQRALRITESGLGTDHPDLAIRLGNPAGTYRELGRAADALPRFEWASRTHTAPIPEQQVSAPSVFPRLGSHA